MNDEDALPRLRALLRSDALLDEPIALPPGLGEEAAKLAAGIHKRDIVQQHQVKFALFERFGVLPGAGDRHLVEFFPSFLTEESGWGKRWGVKLTTIADRERDAGRHKAELAARRAASTRCRTMPSGEMVAPMIDSFVRDKARVAPAQPPQRRSGARSAGRRGRRDDVHRRRRGLRGRDEPHAPAALTE